LSKASPPNTPTAEAQPSPSPNSEPSAHGAHYFAVLAIFFFFGLAALIPVLLVPLGVATRPVRFVHLSPLAEQLLGSPSTWFAPAMIFAGVLAWCIGLLPRGILFSVGRIVGGVLVGFLAYPLGFVSISLAIVGLLGSALSSLDRASSVQATVFEQVVGYLTLGAIMFVGGILTVLTITAAFAIATRYWPRHAFRWIFSLIGTTILGSIMAGVIHYKISLPMLPNRFAFHNFLGDPFQVFFGVAWSIPLVVLVGEPLLAALVGHWLYLAAKEWSAESA
jgi:hypothetical protein